MAERKLETMSDWLNVGADIKIDELRHYLDTLKKQLEFAADDFDKEVEAQAKQIGDDQERDRFYELHHEEYWNYKETFPRILLNSFHVSAYSFLESELRYVARGVGRRQNQVFDVSEMKGKDYLDSVSLYIKRLTDVDAKKFTSWSQLVDGQKLRNIIVHERGKLTEGKDIELARKCKVYTESTVEFASVRSIKEISITPAYCKAFLNTLKVFFAELYEGMKAGNFL